jgi:hypothetical protein
MFKETEVTVRLAYWLQLQKSHVFLMYLTLGFRLVIKAYSDPVKAITTGASLHIEGQSCD